MTQNEKTLRNAYNEADGAACILKNAVLQFTGVERPIGEPALTLWETVRQIQKMRDEAWELVRKIE